MDPYQQFGRRHDTEEYVLPGRLTGDVEFQPIALMCNENAGVDYDANASVSFDAAQA